MKTAVSRIPSWAVAVAGAAMVLVGTVVGLVFHYQTRPEIERLSTDLSFVVGVGDEVWDNAQRAEIRVAAANTLLALAQITIVVSEDGPTTRVAVDMALDQLYDGVSLMAMAARVDLAQVVEDGLDELLQAVRRGEPGGIESITKE